MRKWHSRGVSARQLRFAPPRRPRSGARGSEESPQKRNTPSKPALLRPETERQKRRLGSRPRGRPRRRPDGWRLRRIVRIFFTRFQRVEQLVSVQLFSLQVREVGAATPPPRDEDSTDTACAIVILARRPPNIRAVPSCPSPDQSARLPRKSINQRAEAILMMNADKSCIFQIGNQSVGVRVAALAGEKIRHASRSISRVGLRSNPLSPESCPQLQDPCPKCLPRSTRCLPHSRSH